MRRLKSEFAFDLLLDVTAVDWPTKTPRFEVVYHFYSTDHHDRIRVKTGVEFADPAVDSLVSLFGSANFMERECHDMYGIVFRGNPDLRPILLYEGFVGHPLRKDYDKHDEQPLGAVPDVTSKTMDMRLPNPVRPDLRAVRERRRGHCQYRPIASGDARNDPGDRQA